MNLIAQAANIQKDFGLINPPTEIQGLVNKGGVGGVSFFLNNVISFIYLISAVALVFMLLWGAFQWIVSGGNKDAVASARGRITNALIGIVLLAITFALLNVVGIFTGFSFFNLTR